MGRPNHFQAPLAQAQTKIYIVEVVRQILIKPTEIVEDGFPH